MVFNAQSIRNKVDSLRALMVAEKPETVGITELWVSTDTTHFEGDFEILGYKVFRKDRLDKKGGDTIICQGRVKPTRL